MKGPMPRNILFFASLISYHFRSQLWIKIKPMLSCLVCRQTRTARGRGQTRPSKYLIISHRICTPRAKQLEYHPPRKMKPLAIGSGYPLVVTDTHKWIGYNSEDPQLSCEKTLEAGEAEGGRGRTISDNEIAGNGNYRRPARTTSSGGHA